jgi:D-serine deaminase-like pyridoxal phosphate-dependent protein|tara:strand:- start:697 stop:1965 length:1269 start_codon:yes stop_codon:yes gene_type:complete
MKRRTFLGVAGGGTIAAIAGATVLFRPGDEGKPYSRYFSELNQLLRREGPGRPVMILDLDRMNHNIDLIKSSIRKPKTYRAVVKSLPSIDLLQHVMARAGTRALMVFHQPFLNEVAARFVDADALLGKPMPVTAAREFYRNYRDGPFRPERQIQWLIDTPERFHQYHQLARELGTSIRINIELDVGLHRGGISEPKELAQILPLIQSDPDHLQFAGFMGYEAHLTGMAATLDQAVVQRVLTRYRGCIDYTRQNHPQLYSDRLTLNGAGSHTFKIYERDDTMNDLAAGSGVVKPTDFDTAHLQQHQPAAFIATPVLKRSEGLQAPGDHWAVPILEWWDPNRARTYYIYGGYWKARYESPGGIPDWILLNSTNQSMVNTSTSVDLEVDDYVFLRPTQSEAVMLQFGDLLVVSKGRIENWWKVFS